MTLYMIAVQISETFIDVAILSRNKTVKKLLYLHSVTTLKSRISATFRHKKPLKARVKNALTLWRVHRYNLFDHFLRVHLEDTETSLLLFINVGADLHAVAMCCLLQAVAVAPKQLAGIFHGKLDWIKVS